MLQEDLKPDEALNPTQLQVKSLPLSDIYFKEGDEPVYGDKSFIVHIEDKVLDGAFQKLSNRTNDDEPFVMELETDSTEFVNLVHTPNSLPDDFRRLGFGRKCYVAFINFAGHIASGDNSIHSFSDSAKRVWKTLPKIEDVTVIEGKNIHGSFLMAFPSDSNDDELPRAIGEYFQTFPDKKLDDILTNTKFAGQADRIRAIYKTSSKNERLHSMETEIHTNAYSIPLDEIGETITEYGNKEMVATLNMEYPNETIRTVPSFEGYGLNRMNIDFARVESWSNAPDFAERISLSVGRGNFPAWVFSCKSNFIGLMSEEKVTFDKLDPCYIDSYCNMVVISPEKLEIDENWISLVDCNSELAISCKSGYDLSYFPDMEGAKCKISLSGGNINNIYIEENGNEYAIKAFEDGILKVD